MMKLIMQCAMCGNPNTLELEIQKTEDLKIENLKKRFERAEWVLQENSDNLDAYCSKECAA